jgi:large subunit ribosomal protein L24
MGNKCKIKRDDEVIVITGKDRNKVSKVVKVDRKDGKVIVENVNVVKRHTKPNQQNPDGGIIEKSMPIDISNVMYYCKKCKTGVRLGFKELKSNKKSRFCKKCGEIIDKE